MLERFIVWLEDHPLVLGLAAIVTVLLMYAVA